MYVWIGSAIVVLFLIGRIIRWWNLPKVIEARKKRDEVRQKERTERARIRAERRARFRRRTKQIFTGSK